MPDIDLVDVSHWQGVIDWPTVAGSVRQAYIKASEHISWRDSKFAANWQAAKAAGVARGPYHFFRANYAGEAQAAHFVRTVGADRGELPLAVDVESGDGIGPTQLTANLRRCLIEVAVLTGTTPIIYSSASKWNTLTDRPGWAVEYEWWVADYRTGRTGPALPAHVSTYRYWQFSSTGRVPGIAGNCDLNRERVAAPPPPPPPVDTDAATRAGILARATAIRGLVT